MKVIDPNSLRSRVEFECPACRCRLERRLPRDEKLLVGVASVALLTASLLSILAHLGVLQAVGPVATFLYVLAIGAGLIEIRHGWVRRRFHAVGER